MSWWRGHGGREWDVTRDGQDEVQEARAVHELEFLGVLISNFVEQFSRVLRRVEELEEVWTEMGKKVWHGGGSDHADDQGFDGESKLSTIS